MQRYLSRLSFALAAYLVSGVVGAVGCGFLLAALYLAVRDISSPSIAALSTGATAFLIALLIVLAVRARMRRVSKAMAPGERVGSNISQPQIAAEIGQIFGQQATSWVRCHAKGATVLALVAGFVVGASPELRSAIGEVFKRRD